MIADHFSTFDPSVLGSDFSAAFDALKKMSAETAPGRYEISDRVYINVMEYDAAEPWKPEKLEAHREYADIQVVFSGKEGVAWQNNSDLKTVQEYNSEQDVLFQEPDINMVSKLELEPGLFVIFYPQDAHYGKFAPASGAAFSIRKAVAKVKLSK